MAVEAVRIALTHMTPVVFLSDGYLANSSEPWKLPDVDRLPKIQVTHPAAGTAGFQPYARDPKTLARPWARPGTKGLEHRIGGLGKADITGNVSYDPDNHEKMIRLRAEKVARIADDIPPAEVRGPDRGDLLVLGWGSPFGTIYQAVAEWERRGKAVSHVHLNYINPLPRNVGAVVANFKTVLVPELNTGQLLMVLRHRFPGIRFEGHNRVRGVPFTVGELVEAIGAHL
jgi:2-oxoglutarate ferredoxin oxidoreductase subunit alpha